MTVEERGRGIVIEKVENLQRVLDHYPAVRHPIKLGVGLKDGERWCELWFMDPITAATSITDYQTFLIAYMQERIIKSSPSWATRILGGTSQVYQFVAKVRNNALEMWYMPSLAKGMGHTPRTGDLHCATL
jgi:hypothetical protein